MTDELGGCTGALLLLVKCRLETIQVDGEALLSCDVLRQVEREPVGVIETKCVLAGNTAFTAGLHCFDQFIQQREAVDQRRTEATFFLLNIGQNELAPPDQLIVVRAHELDNRLGHLGEEWLCETQQAAMPRSAAQNQPQDVAATFVCRKYSITDQESDRATVVGNDAVGYAATLIFEILCDIALDAGFRQQPPGGGNNGLEQVGVVVAIHSLQDAHNTLEAHACVHVPGRQR